MSDGKTGLQLRSLLKKSGELELSLVKVPTPEPAEDEVVVGVEASPINPSDLGLLIGSADMSTATVSGSKDAPVVTAKMPEAAMRMMAARLDQSLPVGNEGAEMAVIGFPGGRATLMETAPGVSVADVVANTQAELVIPAKVPEMAI
jgi:hypothetical protein